MDIQELELPDPCLPGCPLVQESWEAAGVSIQTHPPQSDHEPGA